MKRGVTLSSLFVPEGKDPENMVSWSRRDSKILNAAREEIFSQAQVEAPVFWSPLAVDIAASKYFRRTQVPKTERETSIRQMVDRVVRTIVEEGERRGYFASASIGQIFAKELKYILLTQRAAFNSPVWFNLGLSHQYGIKTSGGNFRYFPEKNAVQEIASNYDWPQASACFILSVNDDLMSIFDLVKTEARLFKFGSGTGTNFSPLRGRDETLESGAKSSGLMAFLDVFDRAAGATKSGGTTRRAAKMVCLDADHPEILEFIRWKMLEEMKAQALIREGYSSEMEGAAYKTVSGQNSNNSVRISDEFIHALKTGEMWPIRERKTGKVIRNLSAELIWNEIAEAAWYCADPGVQFSATIENMNPCKVSGAIQASNPCSEYLFLNDSACNLASLNLVAFLDANQNLDIEAFCHTARTVFLAQDILVGLASYPTAEVAENSHAFRPLGLGYANLGAFLMRQGVAYGSAAAVEWTEAITALMHATAGMTSAELARGMGPFQEFQKNQKSFFDVMRVHQKSYDELRGFRQIEPVRIAQKAMCIWEEMMVTAQTFGVRNAQWTVLAPTGTIGLLMDCDTTGIEPDFSLFKTKKMFGGGHVILVNQSVEAALKKLGYTEEKIPTLLAHLEENRTFVGALPEEHLAVFDCAGEDSAGRSLSVESHLNVVAAAQKFLSGGISKTVNMKNSSTKQEVSELFLRAHGMGIKCLSIYRAGSKASEPLSVDAKSTASPRCSECGSQTVSTGGCYRCLNCGHAESC